MFISFLKYEFNFRKVISPVGWSQRIQPPPPGTSTGHKKSWDQWSQSSLDQTGLGPGPPVIRDPMDLHNLSQASIHLQSEIILFFKTLAYYNFSIIYSRNKGRGHFLVNPVKVCVIRPKNSSRTIRCSIYLYSLLNRTIGKKFFFFFDNRTWNI